MIASRPAGAGARVRICLASEAMARGLLLLSGLEETILNRRTMAMGWKFWEKPKGAEAAPGGEKLSKAKDIPDEVGRHLVVKLGKDPDWVWSLKAVTRKRPDTKDAYDVRVFSEAKAEAAGVRVQNYLALDNHPGLILYEGWFDKRTGTVKLGEKGPPGDKEKVA